ncbi:MAG: hypothetical protein PHP30_06050 [Bacteroidales bacterium]|nr:hypothetical protein [Bacteroidales bacterium]MDD3989639.1 hypothetical protein [Bacteroidales bacterium]
MNTFVKIVKLSEFSSGKVKFYSIVLEGKEPVEENTEFYDFLERMENEVEHENDLSNLVVWIELIGEKYGAQEKFFRHEGIDSDTSALPPPTGFQKLHEIVVNDLRIYCLRANDNVVFLFNGGIKTTFEARDCPNVGYYIKTANRFTKNINGLFGTEIKWNSDCTDIEFDSEQEFEI